MPSAKEDVKVNFHFEYMDNNKIYNSYVVKLKITNETNYTNLELEFDVKKDRNWIFVKESFECFKKEEPNIDKLMPTILTQLSTAWMYDSDRLLMQVNERLGTNYRKDNEE